LDCPAPQSAGCSQPERKSWNGFNSALTIWCVNLSLLESGCQMNMMKIPLGIFLFSLLAGDCFSVARTRYVDLNSVAPISPYASWATAATNIQDAVDAAVAGDMVLVTNGVYDSGARLLPGSELMNRVVITNDITLKSVNGPEYTSIVGEGWSSECEGVRGVYMIGGVLSGFTVRNGRANLYSTGPFDGSGAGIFMYGGDGVATNCSIVGNWAFDGGGAFYGTLIDCTISHNSASETSSDTGGGGCYNSTLYNCTLIGNSTMSAGGGMRGGSADNCLFVDNDAFDGGAAAGALLNNCTLIDNSAVYYGGGAIAGTLNNCVLRGNSAESGGAATIPP